MVEDHSQALARAIEAGIHNVAVIHIDAHDDLWPSLTQNQITQSKKLIANKNFSAIEDRGRYFTGPSDRLYNINNFLVAAHRLGIVNHVYWAYPSMVSLDTATLQRIKTQALAREKPFGTPEQTDLTVMPPFLKGTISGVPVTIGALNDLTTQNNNLWLDIDLDFFPELYKNPVSSSYLGLISGLINSLQSRKIDPVLTTIAYSHNGGYLNISNRFFGTWLQQLLTKPEKLKDMPPEAWVLKEEALYQEFFQQFEDAMGIYVTLLQKGLQTADTHYSLAMNLLMLKQSEQAIKSLRKAIDLDSTYILGILSGVGILERSGDHPGIEKLFKLGLELAPENPVLLDNMGTYHLRRKNYSRAADNYRQVIKLGAGSPLTHLLLGDCLAAMSKPAQAAAAYAQAISLFQKMPDSKFPSIAWLKLASTQEQLQQPANAEKTYSQFLKFFPDAPEKERQLATNRLQSLSTQRKK